MKTRKSLSCHRQPPIQASAESLLLNASQDSSDSTLGQQSYVYKDKHRKAKLLRGFKALRDSNLLFDVTLKVDGRMFECHRALLASSSDYFRCMFTAEMVERDQKEITISGVDATSMDLVLKYLYSGEARLEASIVQNLLSAANLFQLNDLKEGCASFMGKELDVDNCIGIHFFAHAHGCGDLELLAWDLITDNFKEVITNSSEFHELSTEKLVEIIRYDDLRTTEEEVFESVLSWLQHQPTERMPHIYDVFQHIRFSLMDKHYFYDQVKINPLLSSDPRMTTIFDEVIQFKLLKNRWMETDLRLEPRFGAHFCRVAVYTAYLDDEKKQVLQLYGQRSNEIGTLHGNVFGDLPGDIENPAMLVTGNNNLYVAGGDQSGTALYKLCLLDAAFDKLESMPIPRKRFCLAQLDQYIYALGGCNVEGNLSSVNRYSEDMDIWAEVASLPKALRCFCCVAFSGKLYVFGGESEKVNKKVLKGKRELSNQTYCYDPREDVWTKLAPMSVARALAGCTVYKGKIYVIGGFGSITESWIRDTSPDNLLNSVEIFDPKSNSWEMGPSLPIPLCAMGVFKYYGTIHVMGGETEDDVSHAVYYLNETGAWETKDEMVTGVTEITIHSSYAVLNLGVKHLHNWDF